MATYKEKSDAARKELIEQILESMQTNHINWVRPWANLFAQRNYETDRAYNGTNRFYLALRAKYKNYEDPRWITFKGAQRLGLKVKKGAKSAGVEYWKKACSVKTKINEVTGEIIEDVTFFPRLMGFYAVFNVAELEGDIKSLDIPIRIEDEYSALADALIQSSRCTIAETNSHEAYYVPLSDSINMPRREVFSSNATFVRTLAHEMIHSTQNATECKRPRVRCFDKADYAFEELIAELGSVFLLADLGYNVSEMDQAQLNQHAAYLRSWMKHINNDSQYFFKAVNTAEIASKYLLERVTPYLTTKEA